VDTLRLFGRGEIVAIFKAALAKEGPLDTRELALRVIQGKGLEEKDTVLRTSLAFRIVQALRLQGKARDGQLARQASQCPFLVVVKNRGSFGCRPGNPIGNET
jgi:hypothetical protein